jgi:hypothetical protein
MLAGQVDQQLTSLDTAVKVEIPRVNEMLKRQKLDPIKPEPIDPKKKQQN